MTPLEEAACRDRLLRRAERTAAWLEERALRIRQEIEDENERVSHSIAELTAWTAYLEAHYGFAMAPSAGAASLDEIGRRVGAQLRALRIKSGLGLRELSHRSGIHRPNLSRLERGDCAPNLASVVRYARALGVSVAAVVAPIDGGEWALNQSTEAMDVNGGAK